jgi:hypothetical protein
MLSNGIEFCRTPPLDAFWPSELNVLFANDNVGYRRASPSGVDDATRYVNPSPLQQMWVFKV